MLPTGAARLFQAIHHAPPPAMTDDEAADWVDRLDRALYTLSPRQADVVRWRYLAEPRPTQADLADIYMVSDSRIGQIERRAREKLRHPSRLRFLQGSGDLTALPWSVHPCWRRSRTEPQPPVRADGLALRDRLLLDVQDLEVSVRVANCFESARIRLVGDLVRKSEADLLRIRYFGRKSLREIKALLAGLGLSLGMSTPGWARMKASRVWRMPETRDAGHEEEER